MSTAPPGELFHAAELDMAGERVMAGCWGGGSGGPSAAAGLARQQVVEGTGPDLGNSSSSSQQQHHQARKLWMCGSFYHSVTM